MADLGISRHLHAQYCLALPVRESRGPSDVLLLQDPDRERHDGILRAQDLTRRERYRHTLLIVCDGFHDGREKRLMRFEECGGFCFDEVLEP